MYFEIAKQAKNDWWRYLLTVLALFITQFIGSIPFYLIFFLSRQSENINIVEFQKTLNFEVIGLNQNLGLVILLIPSVLSAIILWLLIVHLHKQKPGNVFSASGKFRWNRLWTAVIIWLFLSAIAEFINSQMNPGNYEFNFNVAQFIPLVIISVIIIPFQAGFEELLFRSYFMQGIGVLFHYRLIALLLTSIVFGLMHSLNPEVNEFGFWNSMIFYMGFGILAGLLVVFDNGIEMALGIHTINNFFGCIFVTYQSSVLQTAALWKIKFMDIRLMNLGFLLMSIIFLVLMARIYKWENWKKLIRPINFQKDTEIS
jgi:uncharacterized protein